MNCRCYMINPTQSYVITIAECLLIELACSDSISEHDLQERTRAIIQLIANEEEKNSLIHKIEDRNVHYEDNPNFDLILEQIRLI